MSDVLENDEWFPDEPEIVERPRKRRRKDLSKLPDMPLDVLFEIFSHLKPFDLLRLARTTKGLRDILMRKSSISIWKAARAQVDGLPDCPVDLSEPEYAHLAFDAHCHFCLDGRVQSVFWMCRVRCCKRCFRWQFMEADSFLSLLPDVDSIAEIDCSAMLPSEVREDRLYYMYDQVRALAERLSEVAHDEEKLLSLVSAHIEYTATFLESSDQLKEWHENQASRRTEELEELRRQRREGICAKLAEYGLDEEIDLMDAYAVANLLNEPWMKQPKALTNRMWNNIKDTVIDYFLNIQSHRIMNERAEHPAAIMRILRDPLDKWSRSRPMTEPLPSFPDFCMQPQFVEVLTEKSDRELEALNDPLQLAVLFDSVADKWRKQTCAKLLAMMPASPVDVDHIARLNLATTVFQCSRCGEPITYPRILVHRCTRSVSTGVYLEPSAGEHDILNALHINGWNWPWNYMDETVSFNTDSSEVAAEIVLLCGLDPETTTANEMDELDARLVCRMCSTAMSWRRALLHVDASHSNSSLTLTVLDDDGTNWVKRREAKKLRSHPYSVQNPQWCCTYCRTLGGGEGQGFYFLMRHLQTHHGKQEQDAEEGKDYIPDMDSCFAPDPLPITLAAHRES